MSWQKNRRRKRVWYRHYYSLAAQLKGLIQKSQDTGKPIAAEAILRMFFELYERRRLHKRRRAAKSAAESMRLAAADVGLDTTVFTPSEYTSAAGRVPALGEFGSDTILDTAELNDNELRAMELLDGPTLTREPETWPELK